MKFKFTKGKRLLTLFFTFLFTLIQVSQAFAFSGGEISTGKRLYYGDSYGTIGDAHNITVYDNDGNVFYDGVGYCLQHYRLSPEGGFDGDQIEEITDGNLRCILYYGFGGPGYEAGPFYNPDIASGHDGDWDYLATMLALSANSGEDDSNTSASANEFFATYPNASVPERFHAYRVVSTDGAYQDIAFFYMDNVRSRSFRIKKVSTCENMTDNNANYSLEGAEYDIYKSGEYVTSVTTDSDGYTNSVDLEYGYYSFVETKAPKGFELDDSRYEFRIDDDGEDGVPETIDGDTIIAVHEETPENDPLNVVLSKQNAKTKEGVEGAVYAVKYYAVENESDVANSSSVRTWYWKTNTNGYILPQREMPLNTNYYKSDELYYDAKDETIFPLGYYTIQEVEAPNGYILDDTVKTYHIGEGDIALDTRTNLVEEPILETPIEFEFTKTDSETNETMSGVSFKITSPDKKTFTKTSDENGLVKVTAEDTTILGEYKIEELNGDKNIGKDLVSFTVELEYKDNEIKTTIKKGNTSNVAMFNNTLRVLNTPVKIATNAASSNGNKVLAQATTVTVNDTVNYVNLEEAIYHIDGQLMDYTAWKSAGSPSNVDSYVVAKNSKDFDVTIDGSGNGRKSGNVENSFLVDTTGLEGHRLVVFEKLSRDYGNENGLVTLYNHNDWNDLAQTVYIPSIDTTFISKATNNHSGELTENFKATESVAYTNLLVGHTYKIVAELRDKATGAVAIDGKGDEIKAVKEFTPSGLPNTATNGKEDIDFTFDSSLMANKTLVAFADIVDTTGTLAKHRDLTDEDETIFFPRISSKAIDTKTQDHIAEKAAKVNIKETVYFDNLAKGTYTVKSTVMDKDSNAKYLENGKELVKSLTFTVDTNGESKSIDIDFELDRSLAEGHTLVFFEELTSDNATVLTVEDNINEAEQTVYVTKIQTKATNPETGTHTSSLSKTFKFNDLVTYTGLIAGQTYKVTGSIHIKNPDGTDGGILKDPNGNPYTTVVELKADSTNGEWNIPFEVDTTVLGGKTIVTFEKVEYNNILIGAHEDITDQGQTLKQPELRTTAKDTNTQDNVGSNDGKTFTVIDTVHCTNLVVGESYVIRGTLMNKLTGKAFTDTNGNTVDAELSFVASAETEDHDLTYSFTADKMNGLTTVVFEKLLQIATKGDEMICVSSHENIDDEGQSIHYVDLHTTARDGMTNTHQGVVSKATTIKDVVRYENLVIGKTYSVFGKLMVKETGEELKVDGKTVTAAKTFTAESADGEVELEFTFDSSVVAGKDVTVFEDMYHNGIHIGTHSDLNDEAQTISYPSLSTKATINGEKSALAEGDYTLNDTVSYKNLVVGQKYTVKGTLMRKSTGLALEIDGKAVTAETSFIASTKDGEIVLPFVFNAKGLENDAIVAYETVIDNKTNAVICSEKNINNSEQTVSFVKPEKPEAPVPPTPETPVPPTPETGDKSGVMIYVALLAISALLLMALSVKKKN